MSDKFNITEVENQQTESLEQPGLRVEDWITVTVMGFLALITFGNVLTRYFTNQSFAWTEEFSISSRAFICFISFNSYSWRKFAFDSNSCLFLKSCWFHFDAIVLIGVLMKSFSYYFNYCSFFLAYSSAVFSFKAFGASFKTCC